MTCRNKYLGDVFKRPPMIAYKRQLNLREHLIKAKVPKAPRLHQERRQNAIKRCGSGCLACPYIKETKSVTINGINWKINRNLSCKSFNVIYAIICNKETCKKTYIGKTRRFLKSRLDDHRGYVNNHIDTATGSHYTQPGHTLANLQVVILEQVEKIGDAYRQEREEYFIRKFNTAHSGLNRKF